MKPNILLIVADQFRGDCLGCAGHPDVLTPNLDFLAANGTLFTKAYTPDPICVPARATMITGRYPHKCTGKKGNAGKVKDTELKLPAFLSENGYETYASGKLHYVPYSPPGTPRLLNGFQHAALAESGRILGQFDPKNSLRGVEDYSDFLEDSGWKGYTRAHGLGNNDIHPAASPLPAELHVDSWVASKAMDFLDDHRKTCPKKPFFLNVGFPKPHSPYDPPKPYDSLYDPRKISKPALQKDALPRAPHSHISKYKHGFNYLSPEAVQVARAHYFGLIHFQDKQIGRILEYLKRNGLYENTVIIFTADHGDMMGDFGFFFKSCMYEGSIRIPLIVSWPEKLKKAQVSNALVGLQDIVPTLLDIAEMEKPENLDGISLLSILLGKTDSVRGKIVSYSLDKPNQTYMITDGRYKYVYNEINGIEELYDLKCDPAEEMNLIGDKELHAIGNTLAGELKKWIFDNQDTQMLNDDGSFARSVRNIEEEFTFSDRSMGWRWY